MNIDDKKLYIFGAGDRGKQCLSILRKYNFFVEAFVDNDVNKCRDDFFEKFSCIPLDNARTGSVFIIAITMQSDIIQVVRQIKNWDKGVTIVIPGMESMLKLQS